MRRRGQGGVLPQDRQLELLQRLARVDAELVREPLPRPGVGCQRLSLPITPIEGSHELAPEPLPHRVLENRPVQLRHQSGVLAQREAYVVGVLLRHEAQLVEPDRLRFGEGRSPDVGKGRSAPQAERLLQRRGRRSRVIPQALVPRAPLEAREPADVGLIGRDRQSVPGRHPLDQLDIADLTQAFRTPWM